MLICCFGALRTFGESIAHISRKKQLARYCVYAKIGGVAKFGVIIVANAVIWIAARVFAFGIGAVAHIIGVNALLCAQKLNSRKCKIIYIAVFAGGAFLL